MTISELRNMIREMIKEASQTGTGASFQAGDSEAYASPFAFSKKKKNRVVKQYEKMGYTTVKEGEEDDPQELKVGNYQTRHYDMCPGATSLYKNIEDKVDDMNLAERTAKLQDTLFYIEKRVVKEMEMATKEDVLMAQNLADQIMEMAKMMGLEREHGYIQGHVDTIAKLSEPSEQLNEVSYREYKKSTDATPKQKIGNSMRMVEQKLKEIEKLIKYNKKLKEDMGLGSGKYWASTRKTLARLSEKIKVIQTEIINLGN
jgi:hypothetical protein